MPVDSVNQVPVIHSKGIEMHKYFLNRDFEMCLYKMNNKK